MATAKLYTTEDVLFERDIETADADTGEATAAVGETWTVKLSLTKTGSALSGCTWTAAERVGTPGRYWVVGDTVTLVTGCTGLADGALIYEVWTKTGDVVSRSWPRLVARDRVGDG